MTDIPADVPNWLDGLQVPARSGEWVEKMNPATGAVLGRLARSAPDDIVAAIAGAKAAQPAWAAMPGVQRGEALHRIANAMHDDREWIASIVALETGKSPKNALAETDGAIQLARFYAGEGQRLYGRTTTSGTPNRSAMTLRCPVGVAGLIMAANTPIANVAWKVFPALICGNSAVVKPSEDTPLTAWALGRCAHRAGLAAGVLQIVQGLGRELGPSLVEHSDIGVVSFTGSTAVGRSIARAVADRVGRVSLELGGKNAFVVCDDADLELAATWVCLSAFSNAGQRCAAGSRILVFDAIYDQFRELLLGKVRALKVGPTDADDFGPVINERQLTNMLSAVERAVAGGASILCGGSRMTDDAHRGGYYVAPTLLEGAARNHEISTTELFGPISCMYRVAHFAEALTVANDSPYGLTASIHTRSIHRAWRFAQEMQTGVVSVNAGTHGSEPHMPFGGDKLSGNGTREPGTEALDIYSSLKSVYLSIDPAQL